MHTKSIIEADSNIFFCTVQKLLKNNNIRKNSVATLTQEIEKHIRILVNPLKEEEELKAVLKTKLTKKEFKLLAEWAAESPAKKIQEKLNLEDSRYSELSSKLIKKLNQEKFKQEICI